MRVTEGKNGGAVQYLQTRQKYPSSTDLGFLDEASEPLIEPSAQVPRNAHLRVYQRVGGLRQPLFL